MNYNLNLETSIPELWKDIPVNLEVHIDEMYSDYNVNYEFKHIRITDDDINF